MLPTAEIISPDELDNHDPVSEANWEQYITRDLRHLLGCDALIASENWTRSKGCAVEIAVMAVLKKPVFVFKDGKLIRLSEQSLPKIVLP